MDSNPDVVAFNTRGPGFNSDPIYRTMTVIIEFEIMFLYIIHLLKVCNDLFSVLFCVPFYELN